MAKLHLDWSDGRYYTRLLSDEEAAASKAAGCDVVHLDDDVYAAYVHDSKRDAIWQAFWRSISNEVYMQRREKELMPLEEAARKITQLEHDLAQARRMWSYFEEEYDRAKGLDPDRWHTAEARSANDYTCVFPQPGCKIEVLPPKWHERAKEILAQYNLDHAAEGMKVQGCCCGHEHEKLDDATVDQLRNCGFLVEHDSEPL